MRGTSSFKPTRPTRQQAKLPLLTSTPFRQDIWKLCTSLCSPAAPSMTRIPRPLQVAIVNETLARKFYPNLNPVGRYFRTDDVGGKPGSPIQIVGITKDSKYESLREETYATAFFPIAQKSPGNNEAEIFEVRTNTPPSSVASAVQ